MKNFELRHLNINLKMFSVILSLSLILLSLSILNFQSIYSQSSEDEKSTNCSDNEDQSRYVSNVVLPNKSDGGGPATDDLPGFHYVKKFDSNGTLISAWGTKGTGPGQFLHGHGIAVDSSGNVYVSDAEKCNIQKFDSQGNFITMWGTKGTGPGQFIQPESMAVDSKGNLFVVDYANQRVEKFDSKGNFITMWGTKGTGSNEFEKPWGVAVDSNDSVYVSDQKNPLVQKFTNDGKFLLKWGSYGTGNGQFVHLHDVTVDSNDFVYVTDGRNNSRVAKFDSQGDFIEHWGSSGSGNGRFIEDHGIVSDKVGNVYVVDTRNVRIQKFDSQGNFITKWGSFGCQDNQFLIPHDIAIDSSGNIYVTDSGNVHFLGGNTCQSFEGNNWTTTIRKIFTSTMSGDKEVPPVDTDVNGRLSFSVPLNETEIKYRINITGSSDVSSAYIHIGKKGENGEAIVDLLNDSKKNKMKQQTGIVIRGEVLDSELIGSMKGKTLKDLIFAMSEGNTYVNVNTPNHIKGEIRGQIEVDDQSMGN
ncbi:MAG: 6-bladed beta-propeller [Nitrososphaeraceae archaeon]